VSVDDSGLLVTVRPPGWRVERVFDFFFLLPFASSGLAKSIALAFGLFAPRFSRTTAVGRFRVFRLAWEAVATQRGKSSHATNLRTGPLALWWATATRRYGVAEYQRAQRDTSAKVTVQNLEAVLGELASCGLLADVKKIEPPKNVHLRKVPKPGLFELAARTNQAKREDHNELVEHFRAIGVPVEDAEAATYIEMLAGVLTAEERKDPKKVTGAYQRHTRKHLVALTSAAEAEYLAWAQHYANGQSMLASADKTVLEAFDAGKLSAHSIADFRFYFPKHDAATTTANLLLLINERFHGRLPSCHLLPKPLGTRLHRAVFLSGGVNRLDAMLTLHRNGVAAAALLYIIDTGANVATALSLELDFERPTSEPGIVEFFAIKARANYAAIYDVLPVNDPGRQISTVKALRGVVEMTNRLRSNFPDLGKSLFVFRFFQEPSIASGEFLAMQLRYLLKATALPSGWRLSGIRTAVGVDDALDGSGTLKGLKRTLHHSGNSLAVTRGYALHWPVRKSLELETAKYQELFQAGIAANLEGAFTWLGKSVDQAKELLAESRKKGLDFLSGGAARLQGTRGAGAQEPAGDKDDPCHTRVLVTDEQSLAEIIATKRSLELHWEQLRADSTARHNELWIELLAFATAAIAEVKRSRFAYLVPRAERKADQLMKAGFDITDIRL
jgi:hypothetical protein